MAVISIILRPSHSDGETWKATHINVPNNPRIANAIFAFAVNCTNAARKITTRGNTEPTKDQQSHSTN